MAINTTIDFEFADGEKAKMTLAFYALYQIKSTNRGLYDRYNKIMTKGASDELEMITVLYTAYICANSGGEVMSEEEFMIKCGSDRMAVKSAMEQLITPKKR